MDVVNGRSPYDFMPLDGNEVARRDWDDAPLKGRLSKRVGITVRVEEKRR